jgi:hypothetical protein
VSATSAWSADVAVGEEPLQRDARAAARRAKRARSVQPVPRYALTRREAAASLGISLNHFERRVQPELKVVLSGQLVLIPVAELERWVQRNAHPLVHTRSSAT